MVLATSSGETLYMTSLDTSSKSKCNGACTAIWPPFTASGTLKAGSGVNQSMLGTTTRSDGTKQVTYAGHPLYRFSGDHSAGTDNGENLTDAFGHWTVLNASGQKVTSPGSGTSPSNTPFKY
jgi:predicted lipoprotein with Yx(FWY)xxD motif